MSVFDIEADGLNPTKIHCLSHEGGTIVDYDEMRAWIAEQDVLIGHNIIIYDLPALERILGIKIKARAIDTLALSWYLEPKRQRHGLAVYGEEFGVPKPEVEDWEDQPIEVYTHRCEQDVRINLRLWKKQQKLLDRLYDHVTTESTRLINYLTFKMECARDQEQVGWRIDVPLCQDLLSRWVPEAEQKTSALADAMPAVPTFSTRKKPTRCFKQDGTESVAGSRWFSLLRSQSLPDDHEEAVKEQTGEASPNPGSHIQIKDWLYSHGWVPETFKYKRDKETNDVRKIPQVYQEDTPEVCLSVQRLFEKEPALELLNGLSVLNHRIGVVKGFLEAGEDTGYVKARVQGFTNTLRYKHTEVVNLPGVDKPYGEEIRSCLICPEGTELCGSDISGLEDNTKQHYMYPFDPDYVEEMQRDGFDPHFDIAVQAGFLQPEQLLEPGAKSTYRSERGKGKATNFACVYGAQGPTVARGAGIPVQEGNDLVKVYWKRNWSVQAVADCQIVKAIAGQKWLYNPVSRFWYSLRYEKDRFSTLNQGTGVYVFDTWVRNVKKRRRQMVGQFHDEFISVIPLGKREQMDRLILDAMDDTNKQLKLNVKIKCDTQFGLSYAEIH